MFRQCPLMHTTKLRGIREPGPAGVVGWEVGESGRVAVSALEAEAPG